MKSSTPLLLCLALAAITAQAGDPLGETLGPRFKSAAQLKQPEAGSKKGLDAVHRWNQIAIDATGFDHGPPASNSGRVALPGQWPSFTLRFLMPRTRSRAGI
jgi:hypothetical protein